MALINRWTLGRTKVIDIEGGSAGVTSVNTQTGAVVLDASDVGAVATPDSPATYSEEPGDIAAVLVAAGLMAASA